MRPKHSTNGISITRKGGFDALLPAGRNDCGKPGKLDDDLKEKIAYLKGRYPRMGAAAIFRQLKEDGSIKDGDVSESTVNRYVNRLAHEAGNTPVQDMRRYERPPYQRSMVRGFQRWAVHKDAGRQETSGICDRPDR